jgi:hypothetical protein
MVSISMKFLRYLLGQDDSTASPVVKKGNVLHMWGDSCEREGQNPHEEGSW